MQDKPRKPLTTVKDAPSIHVIPRYRAIASLREALRQRFPFTRFRFSVGPRTGSIRIRWINGPAVDDVDEVSGRFSGLRFDGDGDLALQTTFGIVDGELLEVRYDTGFVIPDRLVARRLVRRARVAS